MIGKEAQAASSDGLGTFLGLGGRVETERLGGDNRPDQPPEVEAVAREILGQDRQRGRRLPRAREVVDRLDQRAAEQERPDPVDGRSREVGIAGVRHPARQPLPTRPGLRVHLGQEGDAGLDRRRLALLAVVDLELPFAVGDPSKGVLDLTKIGGESAKVRTLPGLERVVVALGAVDPDAQERSGHPGGQPLGVVRLLFGVERDRDEVGRRVVGPDPLAGDQVADDRVIRPVLEQLVAQPGNEPASTIDQEWPVFGADEDAGQPLGQVVARATVEQEVVEPSGDPEFSRLGLEAANFLERGDRAGQGQREPTHDGQVGSL